MNVIDMDIIRLKQPTILLDQENLHSNIDLICRRFRERSEFNHIKHNISNLSYEIELNEFADSMVVVDTAHGRFRYNITNDSKENKQVLLLLKKLN